MANDRIATTRASTRESRRCLAVSSCRLRSATSPIETFSSRRRVGGGDRPTGHGQGFHGPVDSEEVAPRSAWKITEHRVISQPDSNEINLRLIRPAGREILPASTTSMGRHDLAVLLRRQPQGRGPDHRRPGCRGRHDRLPRQHQSIIGPQVAPYPAGLNDASPASNGLSRTPGAWALTGPGSSWPVRAAAGTSPWRPGFGSREKANSSSSRACSPSVPTSPGLGPARTSLPHREQRNPAGPPQQRGGHGVRH